MQTKIVSGRKFFIYIVFSCLFSILFVRLCYIQFFRSNFLREIASKQHSAVVEIEPYRGAILDANLSPLAVNIPVDSLFAVPKEIKDKPRAAKLLSDIISYDYQAVYERLSRPKSFIWIARKLTPDVVSRIKKLNIEGLGFIKESKRSYPNGELCSNLLGFAGLDNVGLEGLELFYNEQLAGKKGWSEFLRDARQRKLIETNILPAKDGFSLVLNIDEVIQFIAETELKKGFEKFHAKGASIIVMEPATGKILAMASLPTYNPNNFKASLPEARKNRAICDFFEPGSVFKIVTATAALQENKFKEDDKFFCENGKYRVANHILHDHSSHGWLTFTGVISESSNIGTTKIAQALGPQLIYKYAGLYGFGQILGVDLRGEVKGILKPLRQWSKTSIGAVPIGQEVCVTALQLANAISVVANGGSLMRPFIVDSVIDENKNVIKKNYPVIIRQVMTKETSQRLKDILVDAVENGTGKLAKIPSVKVAGKTGTAQKVEANGTYSHTKFVGTFIGFAPADDPKLAITVTFDEPHPYYGGVVAAPVFKEVASQALRYMESRNLNGGVLYEAKRTTH